MAGPHNLLDALYQAKAADLQWVAPPASGGTIDLKGNDLATVRGNTSSNETWKLPVVTTVPRTTICFVTNVHTSAGTLTITNTAGTTIDTVASGDIKGFILAGNQTWKALGGVSATALAATSGAGLIGIVDSNGVLAATTVGGAIDDIAGHILGDQHGFIQLPLNSWRETTAFDVGDTTANGGLLASDTTPVLSAINDAVDGCQRLTWAASNNDQITQSIVLPHDLDRTQDIVFSCRIASGGTTDAVGFALASYFDEGDTAVADATSTNQTVSYLEKIATILAADIPDTAQIMTIGLTPVAHTSDTLNCTATWLSYTKKLLTAS